ncbi:hypothetical protein WA556_006434, partial [Blastocystis sp. ATCC 50177/Nand II]
MSAEKDTAHVELLSESNAQENASQRYRMVRRQNTGRPRNSLNKDAVSVATNVIVLDEEELKSSNGSGSFAAENETPSVSDDAKKHMRYFYYGLAFTVCASC